MRRKTGHDSTCQICEKTYYVNGFNLRRGRGKYCSRQCAGIGHRESGNGRWKNLPGGSYNAVHGWVTRRLGKPRWCEICKQTSPHKIYDWANKSKTYKKDVSDYIRLCRKCHKQFDYLETFVYQKRRKDNKSGFKGVSFNKSRQKWVAQIERNHKGFYLGLFNTANEANLAIIKFRNDRKELEEKF